MKTKKTNSNDKIIKKDLEEIRVSHAMEGYDLSKEDEERLIKIANGETTSKIEFEKRLQDLKDKGIIK